jgi:hypothetical protein
MNIGGKGVEIVCEYGVEIKKLLLKTHLQKDNYLSCLFT